MPIGALRAAIRAGNIRNILKVSREASALRGINSAGGLTSTGGDAGDFLRGRGVDVDAMTAPGTGNPYADWTSSQMDPGLPAFADSLGGGYVLEGPRGGRQRFDGVAANMQLGRNEGFGGIDSRFEGMRTWPTVQDDAIGMRRPLSPTTPPWQGAGTPPRDVFSPFGQSPLGFNYQMQAPLPREGWVGPIDFGSRGRADYITDAMGNRWLDNGYPF